jgi:hypothetical protein
MLGCLAPRELILPEVKPLTDQLKKFYEMNGKAPTEEHLYRECWGIKSACSFVKRKGRRCEIPREAWLKQCDCLFVVSCFLHANESEHIQEQNVYNYNQA